MHQNNMKVRVNSRHRVMDNYARFLQITFEESKAGRAAVWCATDDQNRKQAAA